MGCRWIATILRMGYRGTAARWRDSRCCASGRSSFVTLPLLALFACGDVDGPVGSEPSGPRGTTLFDVTYCRPVGTELKLNLFFPAPSASDRAPAALFLHGGGWVSGDKRESGWLDPVRERLLDRGFVVRFGQLPAGTADLADLAGFEDDFERRLLVRLGVDLLDHLDRRPAARLGYVHHREVLPAGSPFAPVGVPNWARRRAPSRAPGGLLRACGLGS